MTITNRRDARAADPAKPSRHLCRRAETRCNGGACDPRDAGWRGAAGWKFADFGGIYSMTRDASGNPYVGDGAVAAIGLLAPKTLVIAAGGKILKATLP